MHQRSFIKWVGGKFRSLPHLLNHFPKVFKTYYEPFMGSGVVFFNVKPHEAMLNDAEYRVVSTFREVKNYPEEISSYLNDYNNDAETYYDIRREYNTRGYFPPGLRAAQFIYLNKCGYNGLYRVNNSGAFNVAYGKRSGQPHKDYEILNICSSLLQDVRIINTDYREILDFTRKGDFVYLDPPYYKESPSSFVSYNTVPFTKDDHEQLALECKFITSRGVKFALSNSDTDFIRNLYKDYNIRTINIHRSVSRVGQTRGLADELLITNYNKGEGCD